MRMSRIETMWSDKEATWACGERCGQLTKKTENYPLRWWLKDSHAGCSWRWVFIVEGRVGRLMQIERKSK
jgi:hypothetical protein